MTDRPAVSVIVPVYRSEKTLTPLYERIVRTFEPMKLPFEIIFVEDAGGDDSWDVIGRLAKSDRRVKGFRMGRNFGQHNALLCGIREAAGQTIVTLDDDLQHPPEEIPKLLERLAAGADVVYGRPIKESHGIWRNMVVAFTKCLMKHAMGLKNTGEVSAFRAFRTRLRDAFTGFNHNYVSVDVLLSWATQRFDSVTVEHHPRAEGKSNYTLRKLVRHALNLITGFSSAPLRLASLIGMLAVLLGVGVLVYVIAVFFIVGRVVPGFAFLASIIAIFSGTQLFALGIIGEYLARMHSSSLQRPPYVVAESA